MDWDRLRLFYSVVVAGSFTKAAEQLQLSQSSISRQMSALEEELEVPLFHRHPRGFVLNEQGEILFYKAQDLITKIALTEAMLNDSLGKPKGLLKIKTSSNFGTFLIASSIDRFSEMYPDIRLEWIFDDSESELNLRDAHVSLPLFPSPNPELVSEPLPSYRYKVYAHRRYLEKWGVPQTSADLDHHKLLVFRNLANLNAISNDVLLTKGASRGNKRIPYMVFNNGYALLLAIKAGVGVGCAHPLLTTSAGRDLVEVLADEDFYWFQRYLVYPEQLRNSPRIQAFRSFLFGFLSEREV